MSVLSYRISYFLSQSSFVISSPAQLIASCRRLHAWVLSHWVHFTVHSLDFVLICVYFVLLFFLLHICCVIVSTVDVDLVGLMPSP